MLGQFAKSRLAWVLVAIALLVGIYVFVKLDQQNVLNQMNVQTESQTTPSGN